MIGNALSNRLRWSYASIDDCRRRWSDGSPSGELTAWSHFTQMAERGHTFLEFSGSGPMVHLVVKALQASGGSTLVLWVRAPVETCMTRWRSTSQPVPYPDFGVPIEAVIRELGPRLDAEIGLADSWHGFELHRIDGTEPLAQVIQTAETIIRSWMEREAG